MLDLNHYRAPSRFWERIESNLFVQAHWSCSALPQSSRRS